MARGYVYLDLLSFLMSLSCDAVLVGERGVKCANGSFSLFHCAASALNGLRCSFLLAAELIELLALRRQRGLSVFNALQDGSEGSRGLR